MGSWRSLFKIRPFLRKHRLIFFAGIIGILLSSLLTIPVPYLTGRLIDKVFLENKSVHDLFLYIGVIAILYLLIMAFQSVHRTFL